MVLVLDTRFDFSICTFYHRHMYMLTHTHTHTHPHTHTHTPSVQLLTLFVQWKTVSFEGPVHQLFSLFNDLLSKMRAPRGGAAAPFGSHHSAGSSVATTPSPTLPIVAAICLRLQLLHPDHHAPLQHLQQGREVRDNKMVFSEAVRKLSLQNWPHKNYMYARHIVTCVGNNYYACTCTVMYNYQCMVCVL